MKKIGILLIVVGLGLAGFAYTRDTSIEVPGGALFGISRVNNLGMMEERRITLIVGCFLALGGIMLVGFSSRDRVGGTKNPLSETRTCPHCAEKIQRAARLCRYCGRDAPEQDEPGRLKVVRVDTPSAANEAGVTAGDLLLSYAGRELHNLFELKDATLASNQENCEIRYIRAGQILTTKVKSGPLGVTVKQLSFDEAKVLVASGIRRPTT